MLHTAAVPVDLLTVLTELQEKTSAADFALAGGTSLALRLGHRLSVDLDFFTTTPFDPTSLAAQLGIGHQSITGQSKGTLQAQINGVKVEFLRHAYPQLAHHELIESVKLWSIPDVATMKLNAINNRGSKKDFFDVAALLEHFPLETMLQHYRDKYRPASLLMIIRSLAWFEDADAEPDPISLRNETWPEIKARVAGAIRALQ